jgi:hypothetical protein
LSCDLRGTETLGKEFSQPLDVCLVPHAWKPSVAREVTQSLL